MTIKLISIILILIIITVSFSGCTTTSDTSDLPLYNNNDDEQLTKLFLSSVNSTAERWEKLGPAFNETNFQEIEISSRKGLDETKKMIFEVEKLNPSSEYAPVKSEFLEALEKTSLGYSNFEFGAKEFQKGNNESGYYFLEWGFTDLNESHEHIQKGFEVLNRILEDRK